MSTVDLEGDLLDALASLVGAAREELAAAEAVEQRAAALNALVERSSHRYVGRAAEELARAVDALRAASAARVPLAERAATRLGCAAAATLAELAEASPSPFDAELADLRARLDATARRVGALEEENRALLGERIALVEAVLAGRCGEVAPTYGRPPASRPRLLRGVL